MVFGRKCAMAFAKKVCKYTDRPPIKFSQVAVGVALGIVETDSEEHLADNDVILGSRIWTELCRITEIELHVITMNELYNLAHWDVLPFLAGVRQVIASKKRKESSARVEGHRSRKMLSLPVKKTDQITDSTCDQHLSCLAGKRKASHSDDDNFDERTVCGSGAAVLMASGKAAVLPHKANKKDADKTTQEDQGQGNPTGQ